MSAEVGDFGEGKTLKGWGMESLSAPDIGLIHPISLKMPTPGPGEVLVKMVAATVNPVDYKRVFFGTWPKYPAIFGVDGAGVVEAVGEGVTTHRVGDRVHFFNDVTASYGSFATHSLIRAAGAVHIPEGVSFTDAAVSPCAGWTAYECLFDRLRLTAEDTIIINAAMGGVGHFAVQLARHVGATIIAIASGEQWGEYLRNQGCALVIDYKKNPDIKAQVMAFTNNQGATCALDAIDEASAKTLISCLGFAGRIVHIAASIAPPESGLFQSATTVHHVFIPGYFLGDDQRLKKFAKMGEAFAALMVQGAVKPYISATIAFENIREQLLEQQKGTVKGKVLIQY